MSDRSKMQREEVVLIVHEILKVMGIDTQNTLENQADMNYLRKMRKGSEMMTFRAKMICLGTFLSASTYILWLGIKSIFKVDL